MSATVFYESTAGSELATLTNTFKVNNVATDPTTITLVITDPTGAATSYTYAAAQITRTGLGVYTKDIACTLRGVWTYTWIGTGTATDTIAGTWTVSHTELNKLYCSVEELKSRFSVTDTVDDFELRLAVDSACRWIDRYCGRFFWRGTDTRTYVPVSIINQNVDDLVSITTLKTDAEGDGTFETTWTTADYALKPYNTTYAGESRPYTAIEALGQKWFPYVWPWTRQDRVQVVGVFGWPAVPAAVKQAALILAAETFKLKDAPFGVAGFGDFGVVRIRDNPKVARLLNPYINPAAVGM